MPILDYFQELVRAIKERNPVASLMINALIQNDEINRVNADGSSALHIAASSNNSNILSQLIANGARVDLVDNYGNTPLHYAAQTSNANLITHLLAAGASPNVQNSEGQTPILLSTLAEEVGYKTLRALIDGGGDVNISQHNGYSPIHFAADKGLLEQVKLMISSGADVQKTAGIRQETPLHDASFQNNHEIVRELILAGADPNQLNQEEEGPLAILMNNINDHKTPEMLLKFGARFANGSPDFVDILPRIESAAAVHFLSEHFRLAGRFADVPNVGTDAAKQELQQTTQLVEPGPGVHPVTKRYEGESGIAFSTRFSLPLAQKTFVTTYNKYLTAGIGNNSSRTQAVCAALQTYFALENFQGPLQSCFYQSHRALPPETTKTIVLATRRIATDPDLDLPALPEAIWTKIIRRVILGQISTSAEDSESLRDNIIRNAVQGLEGIAKSSVEEVLSEAKIEKDQIKSLAVKHAVKRSSILKLIRNPESLRKIDLKIIESDIINLLKTSPFREELRRICLEMLPTLPDTSQRSEQGKIPSSVEGVIKKAVNELTKEMATVGKKEGDDKERSLLQDGHSDSSKTPDGKVEQPSAAGSKGPTRRYASF